VCDLTALFDLFAQFAQHIDFKSGSPAWASAARRDSTVSEAGGIGSLSTQKNWGSFLLYPTLIETTTWHYLVMGEFSHLMDNSTTFIE
jgi:hypothetical protein